LDTGLGFPCSSGLMWASAGSNHNKAAAVNVQYFSNRINLEFMWLEI
jgi:hypothetical protein